ncbi:hypothetical protein GUJ93_ZPchr0001g31615 [Zizania palustris]|uniref:Uncharacterized protein n=1 Tax=Zizania palustris TaxID=103762 RepID=A0A8J5RR54_ZIZPA|nr:hypothetical protein GUJ93_ZPchr0001g31615 [Zizania palustris]
MEGWPEAEQESPSRTGLEAGRVELGEEQANGGKKVTKKRRKQMSTAKKSRARSRLYRNRNPDTTNPEGDRGGGRCQRKARIQNRTTRPGREMSGIARVELEDRNGVREGNRLPGVNRGGMPSTNRGGMPSTKASGSDPTRQLLTLPTSFISDPIGTTHDREKERAFRGGGVMDWGAQTDQDKTLKILARGEIPRRDEIGKREIMLKLEQRKKGTSHEKAEGDRDEGRGKLDEGKNLTGGEAPAST